MSVTSPPPADAAPAIRHRPPTWRNPRMLLGIALVAASVVAGARLMASADDTVAVWAPTRSLPAGTTIEVDDLEQRRVRFADDDTAARYLGGDEDLPEGAVLTRDLVPGELLTVDALGTDDTAQLVELPLSVAPEDVPATVRAGSVVDVWVAPRADGAGERTKANRMLLDVRVIAVPRESDGFAPASSQQVIVGLEPGRAEELGASLSGLAQGRIIVTRKG